MKSVFIYLSVLFICCQFTVNAQDVLVAGNGSVITVEKGAAIFVDGGMQLAGKTKLINDGTITIIRSGSNTADFSDQNTTNYNYGTGKFVFTGSGTQNILSVNRINRLAINNGGLNLLSDISANRWYLQAGKINTNAFYAITLDDAADAIQAAPSNSHFTYSWFNGNLRRYINPLKIDHYTFPVGDATNVNMAEMDELMANPLQGVRYVNASFRPKPGTDNGLYIIQANKNCSAVNNTGVWHLVTDAAPLAGNYDLKLYINNFKGLGNNDISIIQRTGASVNAADWVIPAGGMAITTSTTNRYTGKNNLSVFGQFGIGVITMVTPVISYTQPKAANALKVYPNPVINNEFYVQYTGFTVNNVRLLAADGKIVPCNFNAQHSDQLKVSMPVLLAKGIYTLQLNTSLGLQSTMINLQ